MCPTQKEFRPRKSESESASDWELLAVDLDGTLLNQRRELTERNQRALKKTAERGKTLVLSTGSPFGLISKEELFGIDFSYAITANGSAVYDWNTGTCLWVRCIPEEVIGAVLPFLMEKEIHIDLFRGECAYSLGRKRELIERLDVPESRKAYLREKRIWIDDPLTEWEADDFRIQKITMNFYPDEIGALRDRAEVKEYLSHLPEVKLTSGCYDNLEITASGVDKGKALEWLCKELGIEPERTIAIGDSLNDYEMLQAAGLAVAMGNAVEPLKELADIVTETNERDGVAVVLDDLMRCERT